MEILFSAVSLLKREQGFLRVILSLSSFMKDGKIKMQTRNQLSVHSLFKELLFFIYYCSSMSSAWRRGGRLKTGRMKTDCHREQGKLRANFFVNTDTSIDEAYMFTL